ncbi:ABC transporter permease [Mariniluteicoccus flavus]
MSESLATARVEAFTDQAPNRRRSGGSAAKYAAYVGQRALGSLGALLFTIVFNFFLFRVISGDPVKTLARARESTPDEIALMTEKLGLDKPLPEQFVVYLGNLVQGELGNSFTYGRPVLEIMLERIGPTLALVGPSTVIGLALGFWIGMVSAWRRGGRFDRWSTAIGLILYAMPAWWLGLILLAVLAVGLGPVPGIFPTGQLMDAGYDPATPAGWLNAAWHLVLPVLTLSLALVAAYALIMRSSLLEEMGEDYLTTARAKGLRENDVRGRHAIPNAMLPTTTMIALSLGSIVSGTITVETIFSIPGIGLLTTDALAVPDYPMLQGIFLITSASVIGANLLANLLYGWLDPRVRT